MEATTLDTGLDGREVTSAAVGALELHSLRFPPGFRHGAVDPQRGYLAVVVEGAVYKRFRRSSATISRGSFTSIPAGAEHSSAFGATGCHVLVIRPAERERGGLFGSLLDDRKQVEAAESTLLGWRIAKELGHRDAYSWQAIEGLALELLACAGRASEREVASPDAWLRTVRELLHASTPRPVSLQELGAAVDRHPAHVARAFKCVHGTTITAYCRSLRLEWAAAARASTDDSLTCVALDAGFADQSHFTRSFKRHHGVTPGRYRELVRA